MKYRSGEPKVDKRKQKAAELAALFEQLDPLLGTEPDLALAEKFNIHQDTVRHRRKDLGIEPCVKRIVWTEEMIALLGTESDPKLAEKFGCSAAAVRGKRNELEIPFVGKSPDAEWTEEMERWLGRAPDHVVAKQFGLTTKQVWRRRKQLGRKSYNRR